MEDFKIGDLVCLKSGEYLDEKGGIMSSRISGAANSNGLVYIDNVFFQSDRNRRNSFHTNSLDLVEKYYPKTYQIY